VLEARIEDVVGRCHIFRMKDFITGNYDLSIPAYIFRQYYDASNKKLLPDNLESQYFGEKVPNPDDELKNNAFLSLYAPADL
jgi:hypothetical protein